MELVGVRVLCVGVAEEATEQIFDAARLEESARQWAGQSISYTSTAIQRSYLWLLKMGTLSRGMIVHPSSNPLLLRREQ